MCTRNNCSELSQLGKKQCLFHRKLSSLASRKHSTKGSEEQGSIDQERCLIVQIYNSGGIQALLDHNSLLKKSNCRVNKRSSIGASSKSRSQVRVQQAGNKTRQTYSETVSKKHIISQTHKKIRREHNPDGTVIELEEHSIKSEEFSVVFKKQYEEASQQYEKRILRVEESFVDRIMSEEGWKGFRSAALRHLPKAASSKGLFAFQDEPLGVCVRKHLRQWESLTEYMSASKPSKLTLRNKAAWLNRCYTRAWADYPTDIANAFHFFKTVYEMAIILKGCSDTEETQVWTDVPGAQTNRQKGVLKRNMRPQLFDVMRSDGWCSFSPDILATNPRVAYEMVDLWLPQTKIAGRTTQADHIITFLEDLERGEYTNLYNQLLSVQISIRVLRGDEFNPKDFDIRYIEHGPVENRYNSMLYDSCGGYASFQPDYTVWTRVSLVFMEEETVELILLRQVALYLLGEPFKKWHTRSLAPQLVELSKKQVNMEEMFIYDDISVPVRLMYEREFRPLLDTKLERDRKKQQENEDFNMKLTRCEEQMYKTQEDKELSQRFLVHGNPLGLIQSEIMHMLQC